MVVGSCTISAVSITGCCVLVLMCSICSEKADTKTTARHPS